MAQSIAVVSGKGGVGKSFFSVNVAAALAAYGHPTLIVDADSGMHNADIILHRDNSFVYDLSDIAADRCSFDDALIDIWNGGALSLIAGAKSPDFIPLADFIKKVSALAEKKFEYVVIDSPAGAGFIVRNVISSADKVVIITNPRKEAVLPAAAIAETAWKLAPKTPTYVVVNMIDQGGIAKGDMTPDKIMDLCVSRLLGVIYETPEVDRYRRLGQLFVSGDSREARQLRNIAERIAGKRIPLLV